MLVNLSARGLIHDFENTNTLSFKSDHIIALVLGQDRRINGRIVDTLPKNLVHLHVLVRLISSE